MLTTGDSFGQYIQAYPIPNKEAHTVDHHFSAYGLPSQLHSDNGKEFVNNQHTATPLYNPSSNPVECFHRAFTALLQTQGPKVQENWDLWLNLSVFAFNTTVSSSTGVTPHYAMFGCKSMLPVDWVFPTPFVEKRTMYHWTRDMMEERQRAYKSMREVQGGRVRQNAQTYKPLTQNIQARCLVWYLDPRIIPGTSHKLRSFWAGRT